MKEGVYDGYETWGDMEKLHRMEGSTRSMKEHGMD